MDTVDDYLNNSSESLSKSEESLYKWIKLNSINSTSSTNYNKEFNRYFQNLNCKSKTLSTYDINAYQNNNTINNDIYNNFIKQNSSIKYDNRITSYDHPYPIIDIAHFCKNNDISNLNGRLSLSFSPGKKDKKWNRDLNQDLNLIKLDGIQVIVCLLEWSEMSSLQISNYPKLAQADNFLFYHLPIRDLGYPQEQQLHILIPILIGHLISGQSVLVHCRGGLGRAGTICACCLCHFGYDGKTAIEEVRKKRPGAIQTTKQEQCVINYSKTLVNI